MKKTEATKLLKQLLLKRRKPARTSAPVQILKAGRVETNQAAREQIEKQISYKMEKLNREVRDLQGEIKEGLDLLEMARCSVYTEELGEVETLLREAAIRLNAHFPNEAKGVAELAAVTRNVMASEIPVRVNVTHLMLQENRVKDAQKAFNQFIVDSIHGARLAIQNERPSLALEQIGAAVDHLEKLDTKAITRDLKLIMMALHREVK